MEVMPDHIHVFVSVKPYVSPIEVVKTIKSITAVKFSNLKKRRFWGAGLWSKGYYVGTAGAASAETIKSISRIRSWCNCIFEGYRTPLKYRAYILAHEERGFTRELININI